MDEKAMIENYSALTRDTTEYKEQLEAMRLAMQTADKLIAEAEPSLLGERYLTTEQVMVHFHISRRALQNYRTKESFLTPQSAEHSFTPNPKSARYWRETTTSRGGYENPQ